MHVTSQGDGMTDVRTGWAEQSARAAHERARTGERPQLTAIASLEEAAEGTVPATRGPDVDEMSDGQVMRAAVNDLQHRLLMLDPQADVYTHTLERLMTAAGADRVCAFMNRTGHDGRDQYMLHAEATASPNMSLLGTAAAAPEAYEDFLPGLFERLAEGEPFGSRTEFLPSHTVDRLVAQDVEALLLLPLFVGGVFRGFLRLDRCDLGRLWSEGETGILVSAAGSISAAIERQETVAKLVQRSHELAALLATSRSITSSIDYDVVLNEIACAAAEALGCPKSLIWEYSGRSDVATYRALYQRDPRPSAGDSLLGTTYYAGDYPGGMQAVREGTVVQQSFSDGDLNDTDRARMTRWGEKTWLSVPLVYGEEIIGMMILTETERERHFTADEVGMARVIGEQAAAALHNARLHRREEDQHRWLAALAEATRVIASRLDRRELLKDVAHLAAQALIVYRAHVYEWDARSEVFRPRAAAGADAEGAGALAPEGVDGAVARRLRDGELVVQSAGDPALSPHAAARMTGAGEQMVLWAPFRIGDETLGAMRLARSSRQGRFVEGELSFARALCEHAAIALNNARLYAQIEEQAMRDGLTGLANHRGFYDRLAEEIERSRRYGTPVGLLMLDIDDFKKLNDTYGHPAGDEVLRAIGRLMSDELRSGGDLAARYGGEEFCVILPNTAAHQSSEDAAGEGASREADTGADEDAAADGGHHEGAAALAERLRRRIAACVFPLGPNGESARLTVSIGVASFPATAEQMDELVARADAALYAAKRAGKDRVEVF
jgi:GGDEF domain-containing protein